MFIKIFTELYQLGVLQVEMEILYTLRSSYLILVGGGGLEKFRGLEFVWTNNRGLIFFQTLKGGGLKKIHASLAKFQ